MKKLMIFLLLLGAFLSGVQLDFAQDAKLVNEVDTSVTNQAASDNSDVVEMPFDAQGNISTTTMANSQDS